jgi:protein arginine kinase
MTIHEFLASPAETARREGPHNKIVMSSRVRLARNLKGAAFPGWAKKAERIRILEAVRPAVESLSQMADRFSETMDNLTLLDKNILVERHLVSR